jgi:transposase-like protein
MWEQMEPHKDFQPHCKYCGSDDVAEVKRHRNGFVTWFCPDCRQYTRFHESMHPKGRRLPNGK